MIYICYLIGMSFHFIFAYVTYEIIMENTYYDYDDVDTGHIMYSVLTSVFFPICAWFTIPYAVLRLTQ